MGFFSFLSKAKAKISETFIKIFGADAAHQFGVGALTLLETAAGVLVKDAVLFINSANPLATPADKRKLAFDKIVADGRAQGLGLTSSLINLLIEIVVQTVVKQNITPVA